MDKHNSTQIYQCDALWVIAGSLGNNLVRYGELLKPKKSTNNKTTDEVVNDIISVLKADIERRSENGINPV